MTTDSRRYPSTITVRITNADHLRLKNLTVGTPMTSHAIARHLLLLGLEMAEADPARTLFVARAGE